MSSQWPTGLRHTGLKYVSGSFGAAGRADGQTCVNETVQNCRKTERTLGT